MADTQQPASEGTEGPPDRLDSIEDLDPKEQQQYELRGGYYYRR
jgi:hypothetical protein